MGKDKPCKYYIRRNWSGCISISDKRLKEIDWRTDKKWGYKGSHPEGKETDMGAENIFQR